MITPGGATAYGPPDNDALPDSAVPADPRIRFRDLPKAERIRRKVQDAMRYYALTHGKVLTAEALGNYFGWKVRTVGTVTLEQILAALNDPVTVANLRELGVIPEDVLSWDEALEARVRPDGVQMDALDAIFMRIDPADERPLATILAEHGVPLKTWNGWLADPIFAGWVRQRTEAVFGERAHEVDIALMRRAAAGDVAAIKLILQLQGRLTDRAAVDAGALLGRVLEVLLEEIPDMGVIERIARRLEAMSQQAAVRPSGGAGTPMVIAGELAELPRLADGIAP